MKVLVIGGVAGGASAAARIRRLDESAQIVVLERGKHVSFSNCSLPYYIGGEVKQSKDLVMMSPEAFLSRYNIDVRVENEAVDILCEKKSVLVRDLKTGEEYEESYDKLVLAPGADAVRPKSIRGADRANVFTVRNVTDACALKDYVQNVDAQNIAVIGGGFVGLEIAESFVNAGKTVSVIEGGSQVMAPFDDDMAQILHKELMDHGVRLYLHKRVTEITPSSVKASGGGSVIEIPAEAALLSAGVRKQTDLAVRAGLAIGESGGIKVDHNYRTSDPDIYAVGDAIETFDHMARTYGSFAQAGPAQRQARAAADHICGQSCPNKGYIATSCLRVFDQNAACTGMSEKAAKRAGIPYEVAYVLPPDKVSIMPDSSYMAFKLVFEVPTGRVLGAQAVGKGDVVRRIDVIAASIAMNATLEDLADMELCYSPVYGTAKDVVNLAALVGLNLLNGRIRQVRVSEVRGLVESGACIIDVREEDEYALGHIKGARNIPLSQLRTRMEEIPREGPVYLHCRTSQRSYYAICALLGHGYRNVVNISGSFLGVCLYEYFNDRTLLRDPIVTAYNFR